MKKVKVFLENFPQLKKLIKRFYLFVNFYCYRKKYEYSCNYDLVRVSDSDKESFFGYYDKSPVNRNGDFIIYQETSKLSTVEEPNPKYSIEIVLFDVVRNNIVRRYQTTAYNWQQGSKLMWVDEQNFIFNDFDEKRKLHVSKIVNVLSLEIEKILDFPIYDVCNDVALSLNYGRLHVLRPDYGYRNVLCDIDFTNNSDDGIYRLNLQNGEQILMHSIESVIRLHFKDNMVGAKHWFNHIMISPNGKKFIFLHRWLVGNVKYDALIISDIDGSNCKCLVDDGMISHCFWNGNDNVIAFLRTKKWGDKYHTVNVNTDEVNLMDSKINKFGDGHPNINGSRMIFDTYPDKARMKKLFVYDMDSNQLEKIGEFLEPLKYNNQCRCDLHPKFSYDGKSIFIDSVHTGNRGLYQILLK